MPSLSAATTSVRLKPFKTNILSAPLFAMAYACSRLILAVCWPPICLRPMTVIHRPGMRSRLNRSFNYSLGKGARIRLNCWELPMLWTIYSILKEAYQNRKTLLRVVRFLRRVRVQLSISERLIGFRIRVPPGTKVLVSKPVIINNEIGCGRQRVRRLSLWRGGKKCRTFEVRESVGRFSKNSGLTESK